MTDEIQLELWDDLSLDSSITTEDLDKLVSIMKAAKSAYEIAKAQSDSLHKEYNEYRSKVIKALMATNKSKYFVDGVGTVSLVEKLKVRVPNDLQDKANFFNWLTRTMGEEGFLAHVGVNYQTLNSLYNQEFDKAKQDGTADNFKIPGIGDPESETTLSFRQK